MEPQASLYHLFGIECTKRNNLHYISPGHLLISAGNNVLLYAVEEQSVQYIGGRDGGGIGAIAVHPSKRYFAVAEKGVNPNVYIYEYPSLQVYKVLREGTERGFAAASFNQDGTTLATVGSYPDFMLTVWNWEAEAITLRSKAFSQDVFRVDFSPLLEGQLITSGTGHIRFWKMARTFTGLKLQGLIGKFGQVELTDIAAYVELPSGVVLSGTESGNLLLWDGNVIKCEVSRKGGRLCHKGAIEVLYFNLGSGLLLSAGDDGYVRTWDYTALENAEPTDESPIFELEPLSEVRIGEGVRVRSMIPGQDHWMVLDAAGGLWRLDAQFHPQRIMESHAGPIHAMAVSPAMHTAATTGADGTVRVFDYVRRTQLTSTRFNSAGTAMLWLPREVDKAGRMFAVGFQDGVVRVLLQCTDTVQLVRVFKPHSGAVTALAFDDNNNVLATGSTDGTIFYVRIFPQVEPIGFITLDSRVNSLSWSLTGRALLVCTESGSVVQVASPMDREFDTSATFEIQLPVRRAAYTGKGTSAEGAASAPSVAYAALYLDDERFLLSRGGDDGGHIHMLTIDSAEPLQSFDVPQPIVSMRTAAGGRYIALGGLNGAVSLRSADALHLHWTSVPHDGAARVSSVLGSYDGAFVVSAADDGLLYVHQVAEKLVEPDDGARARVVSAAESGFEPVADITNPQHYSLQQEKLKAEKDRQLALAEGKKKDVRTIVAEMRQEFKHLVQTNASMHPVDQLTPDEFDLDPEYREIMESALHERVEIARKELQWISAKKKLQLDKLRGHYLDRVVVERVLLRAFERPELCVSTFRTPRLTPELRAAIEQVHAYLNSEEERLAALAAAVTRPGAGVFQSTATRETVASAAETAAAASTKMGRSLMRTAAMDKIELRKQQRTERQRLWDALLQRKPTDDYELPEDTAEIAWAEKNMGDYKLKSATGYIVPEHLRISAEKKRREMVLLEEATYAIRMDFNERVFALRDLKMSVIKNIQAHNIRLTEINTQLGQPTPLFEPRMQPDEVPDQRYNFDRDTLLAYEAEKLKAERRAAREARKAAAGGFGGFGGGSGSADADSDDDEAASAVQQQARAAGGARMGGPRAPAEKLSSLEEEERQALRTRLQYERAALLQKISETTKAFDEALSDLRREKFKIDGELKTTDLKLLLLFQELMLLKEFEKRDMELAAVLESRRAEKAEIVAKMADVTDKLVQRKAELTAVVEADAQLMEQFNTMVPANHPARAQLLKSYRRNIKRSKRKAASGDDNGDSENDDSYDSGSEDDFDMDSEDGEDAAAADVAPAGFEAVYKDVVALRERRLDLDDQFQEIQKTVEALKKEHDKYLKDESRVDTLLKEVDTEITAHQTRKQKRLNEFDVVLNLRLEQLQCIENGSLPQDLYKTLVFTTRNLERLRARISEIDEERVELRQRRKNRYADMTGIQRQLKDWDTKIAELRARVLDVQLLKFGRKIDLDKLDNLTVNQEAEELKLDIAARDRERSFQVESWDVEIAEAKELLAAVTRDNTQKQQTLGDLLERNYKLERVLNSTEGKMVVDVGTSGPRRDREDRERVLQLVRLQAQEIEALRAEISILSHKGGHVYTPAVGPA